MIQVAPYPAFPETIAGAVVFWDRITTRPTKYGTAKWVPYRCRMCGVESASSAAVLKRKLGNFTGCCQDCAPNAKRERVTERYRSRGTEVRPNGVIIDWSTATPPSPGISNYSVEVQCPCGYRRPIKVPSILHDRSGLCGSCACHEANISPSNPRRSNLHVDGKGYRVINIHRTDPMFTMVRGARKGQWGILLEHRLIAARSLGRPLESWEHVHHINRDKLDNRPENLQVITPDKHCSVTAMQQEINRLRRRVAKLEKIIEDKHLR